MKQPYHQLAFTLIEILVVIAVIAILAALLFPLFARARERGHQSSCLSNEKQLGQAVSLYLQDYDQYFPPALFQSIGSYWPEHILPYIANLDVFVCPTDSFSAENQYQEYNLQGARIPSCISYAYNVFIGGIPGSGNRFLVNQSVAQVAKPASTVLMTDRGTTAQAGVAPEQWKPKKYSLEGGVLLADATTGGVVDARDVGPVAPYARHINKTDVLFADGHVQARSISSFFVSPGQRAPGENTNYSPCLDPAKGCP